MAGSTSMVYSGTQGLDYILGSSGSGNALLTSESTLQSDQVVGGTRTVVMTRPRISPGGVSFDFPSAPSSMDIICARAAGSFGYHGNSRALATLTFAEVNKKLLVSI